MNTLTVGVIFKGIDKMGPATRSAAKEMKGLRSVTKSTFGYLGKKTGKVASLTGAILQAKILSRGMAGLEMGTRAVIQSYADLDQAVTNAGAKFGPAYYKGTKGSKEMMKVVRELGANTEFTSVQAAEGLDELAKAGISAKASLNTLPTVLDLATAGQISMAEASDIATSALGAFGLSKAPDKVADNVLRVGNVLAQTATSTKTDMAGLLETMSKSGIAVKSFGGDVETWAAITGALGETTIAGSKAGTAIRNMYIRLAAPASKARKLMKGIGLDVDDGTGNMKSMITVLTELQTKLKTKGNIERGTIMDAIFGKRAVVAGQALISDKILKRMKQLKKANIGATNTLRELTTEMRKGLAVKMAKMQSVALDKGFQIFAKVMGGKGDSVESAVDSITKKLQNLDVQSIADTLKTAFKYIYNVVSFIWDHRTFFLTVLAANKIGVPIVSGLAGTLKGQLGKVAVAAAGKRAAAKMAVEAAEKVAAESGANAVGATVGTATAKLAKKTGAVGVMEALSVATVAAVTGVVVSAIIGGAIGYSLWSFVNSQMENTDKQAQKLNYMTSKGMLGSGKLSAADTIAKRDNILDVIDRLNNMPGLRTEQQKEALTTAFEAIKVLNAHLADLKNKKAALKADREAAIIGNDLSSKNNQTENNFMEALKQRKSVIKVDIHSPVEGLTADVWEEDFFSYGGPGVSESALGGKA